ncbi:MAG: HEAT repeat domain-containing protein [Candidatus Parcubacteria bacterium]|nr:HEAT repeat domain-containing protein [Candidatus Parcubacteria bacterium]
MTQEPKSLANDARNHDDWFIRSHSAHCLGTYGGVESKKTLIECLSDKEWLVRYSALLALRNQVDQEILASVLLLAEDSIADIRIKALSIICKYFGAELTQQSEYWQKVVNAFEDDDVTVRLAVLDGLKNIKNQAVSDFLFSKLIDDSFVVRENIAKILISQLDQQEPKIGTEKLKEKVWQHRDDPDQRWCTAIIEIMAIELDENSVKIIETYLDHPSFTLKDLALFQISRFNSPKVLAILLKNSAPDNNWLLRRTAVEGLANHEKPEAISCLKGLRKDADPAIRATAEMILNQWESKNLPPVSGIKPKEDTK